MTNKKTNHGRARATKLFNQTGVRSSTGENGKRRLQVKPVAEPEREHDRVKQKHLQRTGQAKQPGHGLAHTDPLADAVRRQKGANAYARYMLETYGVKRAGKPKNLAAEEEFGSILRAWEHSTLIGGQNPTQSKFHRIFIAHFMADGYTYFQLSKHFLDLEEILLGEFFEQFIDEYYVEARSTQQLNAAINVLHGDVTFWKKFTKKYGYFMVPNNMKNVSGRQVRINSIPLNKMTEASIAFIGQHMGKKIRENKKISGKEKASPEPVEEPVLGAQQAGLHLIGGGKGTPFISKNLQNAGSKSRGGSGKGGGQCGPSADGVKDAIAVSKKLDSVDKITNKPNNSKNNNNNNKPNDNDINKNKGDGGAKDVEMVDMAAAVVNPMQRVDVNLSDKVTVASSNLANTEKREIEKLVARKAERKSQDERTAKALKTARTNFFINKENNRKADEAEAKLKNNNNKNDKNNNDKNNKDGGDNIKDAEVKGNNKNKNNNNDDVNNNANNNQHKDKEDKVSESEEQEEEVSETDGMVELEPLLATILCPDKLNRDALHSREAADYLRLLPNAHARLNEGDVEIQDRTSVNLCDTNGAPICGLVAIALATKQKMDPTLKRDLCMLGGSKTVEKVLYVYEDFQVRIGTDEYLAQYAHSKSVNLLILSKWGVVVHDGNYSKWVILRHIGDGRNTSYHYQLVTRAGGTANHMFLAGTHQRTTRGYSWFGISKSVSFEKAMTMENNDERRTYSACREKTVAQSMYQEVESRTKFNFFYWKFGIPFTRRRYLINGTKAHVIYPALQMCATRNGDLAGVLLGLESGRELNSMSDNDHIEAMTRNAMIKVAETVHRETEKTPAYSTAGLVVVSMPSSTSHIKNFNAIEANQDVCLEGSGKGANFVKKFHGCE